VLHIFRRTRDSRGRGATGEGSTAAGVPTVTRTGDGGGGGVWRSRREEEDRRRRRLWFPRLIFRWFRKPAAGQLDHRRRGGTWTAKHPISERPGRGHDSTGKTPAWPDHTELGEARRVRQLWSALSAHSACPKAVNVSTRGAIMSKRGSLTYVSGRTPRFAIWAPTVYLTFNNDRDRGVVSRCSKTEPMSTGLGQRSVGPWPRGPRAKRPGGRGWSLAINGSGWPTVSPPPTDRHSKPSSPSREKFEAEALYQQSTLQAHRLAVTSVAGRAWLIRAERTHLLLNQRPAGRVSSSALRARLRCPAHGSSGVNL